MLKTAALLVLGSMLTTIIVSVRSPGRPGPASPPTSSTFNLPRSCAQGASSAPLSGAEATSAGAPGTRAGTIGAGAASDGSAGSEAWRRDLLERERLELERLVLREHRREEVVAAEVVVAGRDMRRGREPEEQSNGQHAPAHATGRTRR